MSFARQAILGSCSFILGMIFICQVIDIPLLYVPLKEEAITNAYKFYELWYEAPNAIKVLFHIVLAIPLLAAVAKLHRWTESAMFFDGTTLAMHLAVIIIYLTIHIQSLRTFQSQAKPIFSILPTPPPRETPATEDEKIEAVRVLAAGNALIALLTLGIIGMQIGQEFAKQLEEKEQREIDAQAQPVLETKKDI